MFNLSVGLRDDRWLALMFVMLFDNDLNIWRAFYNQYWLADCFFDSQGQIPLSPLGERN
jgi:hypothetical protein